MKIIAKIYPYIFALFCASIPFTTLAKALPNILLCVLVVLAPFVFSKENFQTIKKPFFVIIGFVFFVLFITIFLGRWEDVKTIERLFYLPVILVLASLSKQNIRQHILAFVISAVTLLVLSGVNMIIEYIRVGKLIIDTGGRVDELLLGSRPYVSFIYLVAAYLCFYLSTITVKRSYRLLLMLLGIIFIGFIFLIASRISIVSIVFSLVLSAIYFVRKPKYYLYLFCGIIGLGIFLFAFSDNINKRFFMSEETAVRLASEPRYHIWECALESPTDTKKTLFGRGFYGTEQALVDCYSKREKFLSDDQQRWFVNARFNTHNQYLDIYLSMGIFVFLYLLASLLLLWMFAWKNYHALNIVMFLSFFLFTENLFSRQLGVMLVSVVLYLVFNLHKKSRE